MKNTKEKSKAGKIFLFILAAILAIIVILDLSRGIRFRHEKRTNVSQLEDSQKWMSYLPDEIPLSQITIPGTHDSATQNITPSYFLKCQSSSIKAQLENGYRYLDMRLALYPQKSGRPTFHYIHAFGNCKLDSRLFGGRDMLIGHALQDIYLFLASHPSETIIFCVKAENSSDNLEVFADTLMNHIQKAPQLWYTKNRIPTLGEVRGKIVLCSRFTKEEGFGLTLNWSEQNNKEILSDPVEVTDIYEREDSSAKLFIQDRYKYWPDDKVNAFKIMLEKSSTDFNSPECIRINFTSTSGGGTFSHPVSYAKKINKEILKTDIPYQSGIIVVDFATEEIAHHIWTANGI